MGNPCLTNHFRALGDSCQDTHIGEMLLYPDECGNPTTRAIYASPLISWLRLSNDLIV